MFYSAELLSLRRKGKLSYCWLAAILSGRKYKEMIKANVIARINIPVLCEEILQPTAPITGSPLRFSLYLSSHLMYGATKIHFDQVVMLEKEVHNIHKHVYRRYKFTEIQEADIDYDILQINVPDPVLPKRIRKPHLEQQDLHILEEPSLRSNEQLRMEDMAHQSFGILTDIELEYMLTHDGLFLPEELMELQSISDVNQTDDRTLFRLPLLRGAESSFERNTFQIGEQFSLTTEVKSPEKQRREEAIISIPEIEMPTEVAAVPINAELQITKESIEAVEVQKPGEMTVRKRQSTVKEMYTESPVKRRHLDVVQEQQKGEMSQPTAHEIATLPEFSTVELSSIHSSVFIQRTKKISKSKKIIDRQIVLSSHLLQVWRTDLKAHTTKSDTVRVDIPLGKSLFLMPSTCTRNIVPKRWNESLHHMFTECINRPPVADIPQASGIELTTMSKKSIRAEATIKPGDKSEPLASTDIPLAVDAPLITDMPHAMEIPFAHGETVDLSKIESNEQINNTITIDSKKHETPDASDIVTIDEKNNFLFSPNLDVTRKEISDKIEDEHIEERYRHCTSSINKKDLLAMVEVHWRSSDGMYRDMAQFSDVIPPSTCTKADAARAFSLLIELELEMKLVLKQSAVFQPIWIQRYIRCSDSE